MNDFIKRNMPVFVIGLVTVGVFITIIFAASRHQAKGPSLEKVQNEQVVTEKTPTQGPKNSKIVLTEFSDFECPACKSFQPVLSILIEKYKDRVLFVYKHFPLPQHTNARNAAIAAEAANEQGKFWEFGDKLFDIQPDFSREKYIEIAKSLSMDVDKFTQDLDNPNIAKRVDDDLAQGNRIGISSTPTFLMNKSPLKLLTFDDLEAAIKQELEKNNLSTEASPTIDTASETTPSTTSPGIENPTAVDTQFGAINVSYEDTGFYPNNAKAIMGQLFRLKNNTKVDMKFEQIIYAFVDVQNPLVIKPGETFEQRLTKEGLWTFKEGTKKHYGSVFTVAQ